MDLGKNIYFVICPYYILRSLHNSLLSAFPAVVRFPFPPSPSAVLACFGVFVYPLAFCWFPLFAVLLALALGGTILSSQLESVFSHLARRTPAPPGPSAAVRDVTATGVSPTHAENLSRQRHDVASVEGILKTVGSPRRDGGLHARPPSPTSHRRGSPGNALSLFVCVFTCKCQYFNSEGSL